MAEDDDFNFTLMEALVGKESVQEVNLTLDYLPDPANSTFWGK